MSEPEAPKRTHAEIGRAARAKGARKELEVARRMGGKRMVMSGGSHLGGGDLVFPSDSIFHDFLWEVKARKLLPEIVKKALEQASVEARGSLKKPAGIVCPDNAPPVVYFYLDDFVEWATALAEMPQGMQAKQTIRQIKRMLDELERQVG